MKKKITLALLVIESIILMIFISVAIVFMNQNTKKKELLREESPNEKYTLLIDRVGEPDWPFGSDHMEITLFCNADFFKRTSFKADIASDGGEGSFEIEWLEDGVQIVLKGEEQEDAYYILPYEGAGVKYENED